MSSSQGPAPRPSGRIETAVDRSAVTRGFQRALGTDPLFSPLPELALARERVLEEDGESTTMVMRDRRLDRSVALKVMKGELAEPRTKRFLREAMVLARLCHPSIPPVLDAGRATNGQPFIMLPLLSGPNFTEQLDASGAAAPMIALLARVADAVAHAHAAGIVHGRLDANAIAGEWITGWAQARDLSGKIPDDDDRPDESADVKALRTLVQEVAKSFDEAPLAELAKKTYRDAAGLADDLRELLAAAGAAVVAALLHKKSGALEKDLEAVKSDLKAKEDADAKRAAAEKVRGLVADALARSRNGETDATRKAALEALELEKSDLTLTAAGLALARVNDAAEARKHLKAAASDAPPAFAALVALHDLEGKWGMTDFLREVRTRGKDRPEAEPYLALVECVELSERKDTQKALAAADRAVSGAARDPANARRLAYAWVARATCRAAAGDVDGALADWERAIELDPRRARSWVERSALRRQKGQLDQAQADADRALAIEPKLSRALVRRAQVQLDRGNDAGAIADLSRAIELDSKDSEAWTLRGTARSRTTLDGALADFDRALEIDPRHVDALVGRGRARLLQRQTEIALKDLSRAIEIDARCAAAYGARGEANRLKAVVESTNPAADGEKIKSALNLAIQDLDRAIELDGKVASWYDLRARSKQQRNDPAKNDYTTALADLDKAIGLQPKNADFWNSRGYLRMLRNEFDAAENDFSTAIECDSRVPALLSNRALARIKKNDLDGATADTDKALTIDPRLPPGWRNRGLIATAKKQYDEAIAAFDKAIALNQGGSPLVERSIYLGRADARAAKGDADGAVVDYEKCLTLQKDGPETKQIQEKIAELKKKPEEKPVTPDNKPIPDKPLDDKP